MLTYSKKIENTHKQHVSNNMSIDKNPVMHEKETLTLQNVEDSRIIKFVIGNIFFQFFQLCDRIVKSVQTNH